jgi:hypothetical protein
MIDRSSQDLVVIHEDKEDFAELLEEAGITRADAQNLTSDEQTELRQILKTLADSSFNKGAAGQVKVVAGKYHFPLRKTIFTAVVIVASFGASGIALATAPITSVVGITGAVSATAAALNAVKQLSELVTGLNVEEVLVYETLLEVARQRKANKETLLGGTLDEVEDVLKARGQHAALRSLRNVLGKLVNDKVITKLEGNETRYSVTR